MKTKKRKINNTTRLLPKSATKSPTLVARTLAGAVVVELVITAGAPVANEAWPKTKLAFMSAGCACAEAKASTLWGGGK